MFDQFTDLYELSKTLRFELKPVGETERMLDLDKEERKKYFPKDKEKAKNYQRIKYYIDLLHRDFIKKALAEFKSENNKIDLEKYFKDFENDKTEDKDNKLKKEITNKFTEVGKSEGERICETYKLKCLGFSEKESKNDENKKIEKLVKVTAKGDISGVLFGKEIIGTEKQEGILETLFYQGDNGICSVDENRKFQKLGNVTKENKIIFKNTEGEKESIFKNFKGFTTYFGGFHKNRKNLYKNDGKVGRIATRIIDENLPRFCINVIDFKYFTDKYPQLVEKFNKDWKEYFEEKTVGEIKMSGLAGIKKFAETNYDWRKLFEVNYYNNCLLQEDINTYNYILRKLNKDINEFKQKLKAQEKEKKKSEMEEKLEKNIKGDKKKLRNFKELHKQILGKVTKKSDFIEVTTENIETHLSNFIAHSDKKKKESVKIINDFVNQEDFDEIYFSNKAINTISNRWFSNWHIFGEKILEYLKSDEIDKNKRLKKDIKKLPDFISLENIKNLLESAEFFEIDKGEIFKKDFIDNEKLNLQQGKHWQSFLTIFQYEFENLCIEYKETKETLEVEIENLGDKKLETISQDQKKTIKAFADSSLNLYQLTKYFAVIKGGKNIEDESKFPKNSDFYNLVDGYLFGIGEIYDENKIFSYYNALRNFLTKKPWSDEEKIKLNFESGSPLKYSTRGVLFRNKKEGKFFLGVIKKDSGKFKDFQPKRKDVKYPFLDEGDYEVMKYQQIKFQTLAGKGYIRDFKVKYSEDKDAMEHLQELIKRQYLDKYPALKSVVENKYENKKDFDRAMKRVIPNCYSLIFKSINEDYVLSKVSNHELLLFEIYNKDFSNKTNGNKNLHTIYFKALFKDKTVFKLNNEGAEIFFREKTDEKKLGYRKDDKGEIKIFIDKRDKNKEKEVIKNRRYAENKIFFHLPIVLNFGAGSYSNINQKLNNLLISDKNISDKIKIIGIDRGEKHLAYYSVINTKGEILDQGSFNKIYEYDKNGDSVLRPEKQVIKTGKGKNIDYELKETGKKVPYTDYQVLLDFKEKKRLVERQSWTTIENIKELKEGYISHVVHQLCNLIFKYLEEDRILPIIVFENLNTGFKQGRQKIEKQIYQKLELRLAQKLNFLTQKNKKEEEIGGILKALQFTPEIKNFGADIENKNQVGTIFYVDPSYTSTTCPNCGFRKRLTKMQYESVKKTKEKFSNIQIKYKDNKYKFIFITTQKQKNSGEELKIENIVYSDIERLYWDRENKSMKKLNNTTKELDSILRGYREGNISENIKNIDDSKFWKKLLWCLHLILQIRNSENKKSFWNKETEQIEEQGQDRDFLECPHCHFHSENPETWQNFSNKITDEYRSNCKKRSEKEEFNGDANGAYNTARKWIVQLGRIKEHSQELSKFKEKWGIVEFPKNKEDKKKKIIDSQKYVLSLDGVNYQLKKKGAKKNDKIEDGKKVSKYPDLFISNQDWDNFVKNG